MADTPRKAWIRNERAQRDTVGKFWVVIYPTPQSTVADILFESDVFGMILQARGGLEPDQVKGIFADGEEAREVAEVLIEARAKMDAR